MINISRILGYKKCKRKCVPFINTFLNNDFEYKRDSDYVNSYIDKIRTVELIRKFSKANKLFPIYINKINISPNLQILDIYTDIIILTDEE